MDFLPLSNGVDFVVTGTNVVLTTTTPRRIVRVGLTAE
jgi:hypothetical protein